MAESPGWPSILNTTIPDYLRDVSDNTLNERILLKMLSMKGRISFGNSGTKYVGRVRYKRGTMMPYASDDVINFARVDRYKTWEVPNNRAYVLPQQIGWVDELQNSGTEAIINMVGEALTVMEEDLNEQFCDKLYIDGDLAANSKELQGIETFLGTGATPVVAAPGFIQPNDTYATLSTALAAYGGSWTNGTWPQGGNGLTPQYSFWSPILVDYTSPVADAYTATTRIWRNTCVEALRNLTTYCRKMKSKKGALDLLLLEETLFRDFKNFQEQYKQVPVLTGEALGMRNFGFDVVSQDGLTISTEIGIPVGTGYAFNTNQMELRCLTKTLFDPIGPLYDELTNSKRWALRFCGNATWNPKFFGKLYSWGQA